MEQEAITFATMASCMSDAGIGLDYHVAFGGKLSPQQARLLEKHKLIYLDPHLRRESVLKKLLWSCVIISFLFWVPACSKKQIESVLDDISRDTYEKSLRQQRIENIEDPNYEDPPSYDQYQRDRKEMLSDPEISQKK